MLPSANSFLIVGSLQDRRIELFQAALKRLRLPAAAIVSYQEVVDHPGRLAGLMKPDTILRIESPGKDRQANYLFLQLGACAAAEEGGYASIPEELVSEKGLLYPSRQWYLGLCDVLKRICAELGDSPPGRIMNSPAAICTMFDKRKTHSRLAKAGLPVPLSLGAIRSYEGLHVAMKEQGCSRVFIKPAHGSSAAGIIAYETHRDQHKATTTIEVVEQRGKRYLYNTRRLRIYRQEQEIALLINQLCQQHVHIEQWIPKAQVNGYNCDLRVVVINGQPCQSIVRLSRSPMTNLHLLNERAEAQAIRPFTGEDGWQNLLETCRQAAALWPDAFYAGLDLLFTADWQRHFILELNAFGDLLPTARYGGLDSYETEISQLLHNNEPVT